MSSSASYAAPSGEGRETRAQERALFPWPVGADAFWVAHTVAWLFIAVFGFASRLAAFDSVGLALALTMVLEPGRLRADRAGRAMTGGGSCSNDCPDLPGSRLS